jgi:hypothetical protein
MNLKRHARLDPIVPSRASYRLIRKLLDMAYAGRVEHRLEEYSRIEKVFARSGGRWEVLYRGSGAHLSLLKKILSVAFKKGFLTRRDAWK